MRTCHCASTEALWPARAEAGIQIEFQITLKEDRPMTKTAAQMLVTLIAGIGLVGAAQAQKAEVIHWWTSGGA